MKNCQEKNEMVCWVSMNINLTALLRLKQLQQTFQRFCQMGLTS